MFRTMLNRLPLVRNSGDAKEKAMNSKRQAAVVARLRLCSIRLQKECRADCVKPPLSSLSAVVRVSSTSSKLPVEAPGTLLTLSTAPPSLKSVGADDHFHDLIRRRFLLAANSHHLPSPQHQD